MTRQETRVRYSSASTPEPDTGPRTVLMKIGPDLARQWLEEHNTHNRILVNERVVTYARDMTHGDWRLSNDAITFDINGTLQNGQHRLWAVIESGATIEAFVGYDFPPDAQDVMDTGRKRSASDMLALAGEENAKLVATACTLAIFWSRAVKDGTRLKLPRGTGFSVTHSEVREFLGKHPEMRDACAAALRYKVPNVSPAVRAFVLWRLRQINAAAADTFLSDMATMNLHGAGDPRAALMRRLTTAAAQRQRLERAQVVVMIFRTWNAWRTGRSVAKTLSRTRSGDVSAEEPQ
jgi:hypothetical protein